MADWFDRLGGVNEDLRGAGYNLNRMAFGHKFRWPIRDDVFVRGLALNHLLVTLHPLNRLVNALEGLQDHFSDLFPFLSEQTLVRLLV